MKLSLKTHNGKADRPVIILVHGLGMNNYFWVDPQKSFVLGGLAPLTIFLGGERPKSDNTISFGAVDPAIKGLWDCLKKEGYSLISWSQNQPLGPIQIALDELKTVIASVRQKWPGKKIFFIGHSRGGLIARQYLARETINEAAGLITICSPHAGTGMAKFSRYLKPAGKFLEKVLPDKSSATLTKALSRLSAFLQSPAITELEPGSEFMTPLQKDVPPEIAKLSFGGTNPALFHLIVRLPSGSHKVIKFPDLLAGAVPSGRLPKELTPGLGDALVSAESANLRGGSHYDFPVNHVKAAYEKEIHKRIVDFLQP